MKKLNMIYRLTEFCASGDVFTEFYKTIREANSVASIRFDLMTTREKTKTHIYTEPVRWDSETKEFEAVSETLAECFDARNPIVEFDKFDDWEVVKIREKYTIKFDALRFENEIKYNDASDDDMWDEVDYQIFEVLDNDKTFLFAPEKEIIKDHFNDLFDKIRADVELEESIEKEDLF